MALTSHIMPYDPQWPTRFKADKPSIASAFGEDLIAIHHVGSTAVPGLAAKPEIDVLVEVHNHHCASARDRVLIDLGYRRGSDLTPDHHFYRRDVQNDRTHKLHVCRQGHVSIARMLGFRDLLRQDPALRQQYQSLKLQLEASNVNGMAEYLEKKAPFIIETLLKAGVIASR
ncbi:GrpB family protein [Pseudomonas putida]|uniref:GrpB family protein n=1 Tax=Pseudomonas putida TaxID=303 RepID=UPI0018A886C0|nr:GrpB family protein [Pseudomonas putida]MBF8726147.1 GrpB family protein [Pseudomonas putida]